MSSSDEVYARIFLRFLDVYGDDWLMETDEFREHVSFSCEIFGVDESTFYEWLNSILLSFIRGYLRGFVDG